MIEFRLPLVAIAPAAREQDDARSDGAVSGNGVRGEGGDLLVAQRRREAVFIVEDRIVSHPADAVRNKIDLARFCRVIFRDRPFGGGEHAEQLTPVNPCGTIVSDGPNAVRLETRRLSRLVRAELVDVDENSESVCRAGPILVHASVPALRVRSQAEEAGCGKARECDPHEGLAALAQTTPIDGK